MENGLLSDVQWGITPGRSTTTALLSVLHNIMQLAENGNDIGLVFFHLLRAFDSVPHQPLLEKYLSLVPLTSSSSLVLYADVIRLYKPISCQADYAGLQLDIDATIFV